MNEREAVVTKIEETLAGKVVSSRRDIPNKMYIQVQAEDLPEAVRLLFDELSGRYVIMTGVDTPAGVEVLYHFSFDREGLVVTLNVLLDKEKPQVDSITPIIAGANWIEREIHELLGVEFVGHPNMRRLLLAEDWPEGVYPLRRSYGKKTP